MAINETFDGPRIDPDVSREWLRLGKVERTLLNRRIRKTLAVARMRVVLTKWQEGGLWHARCIGATWRQGIGETPEAFFARVRKDLGAVPGSHRVKEEPACSPTTAGSC